MTSRNEFGGRYLLEAFLLGWIGFTDLFSSVALKAQRISKENMQTGMMPFGMSPTSPAIREDGATDAPMGESPNTLDADDIRRCVQEDFSNDCKDKEEQGWTEKREWDIRAYYQVKDFAMMNRPWPGASAYPVPITPTLLDTGKANLMASKQAADGRWMTCTGVGEEDIRKAVPLDSLMNWQLNTQIPMDEIEDMTTFRMLLHGDGMQKVIFDPRKQAVKIISFDVENFYIPIDAEGVQFDDNNGHCTQIIPLTRNDVEMRKAWGIYEDLDKMMPGARISSGGHSRSDGLLRLKDEVAGQDREGRNRRETYFLAETYKEYFPKSGSGGYGSSGPSRVGVKPVYITVWWSPNGGAIHRIAINKDKIVPFSRRRVYPNPGYFFSMSMPEKIRHIQEKANYADKQNTDSLDISIMPPLFFSDTSELEKSRIRRMPAGMYNLGRDQTIQSAPLPPRERGFEVEIQRMWSEAQNLTGLIDISIGKATGSPTLGQDEIRSYRADIRFSDLFKREQRGFKDTLDLVYHYDNKFMDRKTKVKILGYADYKSIDELFPNKMGLEMGLGIEGKFDFSFAGAAVTDREKQKMDKIAFYGAMSAQPDVMANPHDSWNVKEALAEAHGIRDLETVITKPIQALIQSAQESVQRIVSGQTGIHLRPGIDTDSYIFEIELFMRSETFMALDQELQMELMNMRKLSYIMRAAEMRATMDMQIVQQRQMANQQASAISAQAEQDVARQENSKSGVPA